MRRAILDQPELFDPIASLSHTKIPTGVKPFIKWAGGKSQLLPVLRKMIPNSFNRYFEPFLGGGALFFDTGPSSAILADANEELVNCYRIVQTSPKKLLLALVEFKVGENEYYKIRAMDPTKLSNIERAARFLYLNKTCFNGLYRVNKQGRFNTPFGHFKNVNLADEENLFRASDLLQFAEVRCIDYHQLLMVEAKHGDFIYLDPPYLPISKYSDFKRYTKNFFYEEDHVRLASLFKNLHRRGCKILLSNSYHPVVVDLYEGFNTRIVEASRFINCKGNKRGAVRELIVSNFYAPLEMS
ncbi:MAG: DNA adenine methylase [Candidatus Omnitrophica bacterium]|nr:DNA adenine methylase [Candidatus Omnitrophota bacterium]